MKIKFTFCWIIAAMGFGNIYSQTTEEKPVEKPSVKISGYVRTETIYDSYINTDNRDGEMYYYPKRNSPDIEDNDKNEVGQFEMLGLQSRIKLGVTGGSAFGAKLSGAIETDFLGAADAYKFHLRLRHAFMKMDWEKTSLLIGQFWHPVVTDLTPNTVSFASGLVFHPLNRPVQIRVTQTINPNLKIMAAITTFSGHRPTEFTGTNSQRNSGLPEFVFQTQAGSVKSIFGSATIGYKFLKPYLTTYINEDSSYKATKTVGSYFVSGTFGVSLPELIIKLQGNYGENLTPFSMIGGYAPVAGSVNNKGEYDYTNMKTVALWTDIETKGSKVKLGLFAGYTKNLGTDKDVEFVKKEIDDNITINSKKDLCRDPDLESVFRIAPRIYFIQGPIDLGIEYTITGAAYGTFTGKKIIDVNDKSTNHRIHLSIRYTF